MEKRSGEEQQLVAVKRPRQDIVPAGPGGDARSRAIIAGGPPRTSGLLAPVMLLSGHEAEIFTAKFSPNGETVASGSQDRRIFLWNTYGECENYAMLAGHSNAVMEVQWSSDGRQLYSASVDKTCAVWDAEVGARVRRFRGHTGIINSCSTTRIGDSMIATGSDDSTVKVWDARHRNYVHSIPCKYQITAVAFGGRDDTVLAGGLDNKIHCFDLRTQSTLFSLEGHTDTVTCVRLNPEGTHVLTNGMDNTVRVWDVQPFCAEDRLERVYVGAQHNFEKNLIKCAWSPDGRRISAGSADRNVYVWDAFSGNILYCLPGHKGSVNEVAFHPKEPILLSASSDRKIYLGELM